MLADGAGVLVPPGRPDELRAAILDLARSPERRRELGAAARVRAARYSEEHEWEAYVGLYRGSNGASQTP